MAITKNRNLRKDREEIKKTDLRSTLSSPDLDWGSFGVDPQPPMVKVDCICFPWYPSAYSFLQNFGHLPPPLDKVQTGIVGEGVIHLILNFCLPHFLF